VLGVHPHNILQKGVEVNSERHPQRHLQRP
jgi:hypothetical protein